ncbi:MAG TPA: hypothetical protein VI114_11455 [Chthoniobacterales bacterium]
MENFRYIVEEFRKAGGIVQLHSADALVPTIADLLRNPAAGSSLVTRAPRAKRLRGCLSPELLPALKSAFGNLNPMAIFT